MNSLGALRMKDRVACTCDPKCPGYVVQASNTTFVDNRGSTRVGDRTTNCCGCPRCPCPNMLITGSTKTFIDNRGAARMGDQIRAGKALTASTKTFIG